MSFILLCLIASALCCCNSLSVKNQEKVFVIFIHVFFYFILFSFPLRYVYGNWESHEASLMKAEIFQFIQRP